VIRVECTALGRKGGEVALKTKERQKYVSKVKWGYKGESIGLKYIKHKADIA
jgi:hypothetical protein